MRQTGMLKNTRRAQYRRLDCTAFPAPTLSAERAEGSCCRHVPVAMRSNCLACLLSAWGLITHQSHKIHLANSTAHLHRVGTCNTFVEKKYYLSLAFQTSSPCTCKKCKTMILYYYDIEPYFDYSFGHGGTINKNYMTLPCVFPL